MPRMFWLFFDLISINGNLLFFIFIMSFGEHAYQHRFFREPPLKSISYGPLADYSLRRATSLSPSLDYSYNTILLDRYRKEAELYKQYRKLGYYGPGYLPPISRLATEPILDNYLSPSVVYLDNPESIQLANQARNALLQRQKELARVNQQKEKERERANQLNRKYNKLKNRVREETNIQRIREMEERRQRAEDLEYERRRMEEIQQAMHSISHQLAGNSRLLNENIRLKQDLQRSQMSRSRLIVLPSLAESPVLLQKPPLDTQYKQMYRLRKQIGEIDRRLSNSSQK